MLLRGRNGSARPDKWLSQRYQTIRRMTERLAAPLSPEDCLVQSMPEASPVKWHLAHTSWFFETFVLQPHAPGYKVFHPSFSYLFNSYYNAVGDRVPRPRRGLMSRPGLDEVHAYRSSVDQAMGAYLDAKGDGLPQAVADVIELGINHEQQHQELILTDIKHALAQNPLYPAYRDDLATSANGVEVQAMEWLRVLGRLSWIGHGVPGFAFDNEGPRHQVYLDDFQIGSRLVTCGEFLEFINQGGYDRPELWLSDGWNQSQSQGWKAPLYWEQIEDAWWLRTMTGFRPIDEAEPVCHVSFYEADAFARWSNARLPTEAEWELAVAEQPLEGNFLDTGCLHPRADGPCDGLRQGFGDVWEWTRSPYTPYPGSQPISGALGEYNAKFMCNQMVLRGGSCATPASHIRATYRNFFSPETRWQFAGLRLAKDS
ncbi:MAG: ergothioneine biosynthesis protein EgtB [Isosphaeraceae bacterium]